jgi:8-oxo-dGTP pyrophosphatase MutT (NUDIX family)
MPKEISAGIIIYKREKDRDGKIETKYLLLYHNHGYWNFPKGKIEKGELSYQAAFREVYEETNIPSHSLKLEKNFKIPDKFFYQSAGRNIFKIVILFLAQAIQPEVKITYKHDGYAWFTFRDAQKIIRHYNIRMILKKAHEYLRRKSY